MNKAWILNVNLANGEIRYRVMFGLVQQVHMCEQLLETSDWSIADDYCTVFNKALAPEIDG